MTALETPASDAPVSEWGALAVSIPGWRWIRGMHDTDARTFIEYADCGEAQWLWAADDGCEHLPVEGRLPDPDDPATAGCLLALMGPVVNVIVRESTTVVRILPDDPPPDELKGESTRGSGATLGRACIAAAAALGRWPGGAS